MRTENAAGEASYTVTVLTSPMRLPAALALSISVGRSARPSGVDTAPLLTRAPMDMAEPPGRIGHIGVRGPGVEQAQAAAAEDLVGGRKLLPRRTRWSGAWVPLRGVRRPAG